MSKFLQMVLVAMAGLVLISLFNFWQITRPQKILFDVSPEDYGLAAEEVEIITNDGVVLSAWYIPSAEQEEGGPAVILLHGYPAEKSDMLPLAQQLRDTVSLLLLDHRFFGDSGGTMTTLGVREVDDTRRAVRYLQERGHGRIGVFGFSFGGAVALMAAAEEPAIDRVGTYAAYADLRTLGREAFSILPGINYVLVELINAWSLVFIGALPTDQAPVRAVKDIDVPVLLVHSREDEQVSFRHAERLQEALTHNEGLETMFFDSGRHGVLPPEFYQKLKEFFSS